MKITRFEEIEAWQQARKLVNSVYEAIRENDLFQKDYRPAERVNEDETPRSIN